MTKDKLLELLQDPAKLRDRLDKTKDTDKIKTALKQYNPATHDVMDNTKRPDKQLKDAEGNITGTEPVSRIAVAMQKLLATRTAAFLCANPIELDGTPEGTPEENMLEGIKKVWEDNKLDFKSMELAEKMMSETEVAELWYVVDAPDDYWIGTPVKSKVRLRMGILAPSLGDTLYPIFDPHGDMIAFGRGYTVKDDDDKDEEHLDIYTDTATYFCVKVGDGWDMKAEANIAGKIPVIYHAQSQTEWADVQTAIDRLETILSNHADTNDYNGSPIFLASGQVNNMPEKTDTGKALMMENGGDAKFLSWDHAPESIKMEIENLLHIIFGYTDTPDISFDVLKGIGQTSGFALLFMFMGAHLKAAKKAGIFGEGIQRRMNYIKYTLSVIDAGMKAGLTLKVKPKFEFFLPKDDTERINNISTSVAGGFMSIETAVGQHPYIEYPEEEMKRIKEQNDSADALDKLMNSAKVKPIKTA